MNIKGVGNGLPQQVSRRAADEARKAETLPPAGGDRRAADEQNSAQDRVALSPSARTLQAAEKTLKDVPEVNSERVRAIRSALEKGTYTIDNQRVAEKLLGMEQDLS